jgi:hypothetical protein
MPSRMRSKESGSSTSVERSGWICSSGEELLASELLVREIVVGRHVALVAPPDVPAGPVAVFLRQALVQGAHR